MRGREVRAIREARGETQWQFAQVVGVDETTIWRWENDRVSIPRPAASFVRFLHPEKLADALTVTA